MKKCMKLLIAIAMVFVTFQVSAQQDSSQAGDTLGYHLESTVYSSVITTSGTVISPSQLTAIDSNRTLKIDWSKYADDTSLTYQQIIQICDSMFEQSGAMNDKEGDNTQQTKDKEENDNTPYFSYLRWKQFWATRLDGTTGKVYGLKKIAALKSARSADSWLGIQINSLIFQFMTIPQMCQ